MKNTLRIVPALLLFVVAMSILPSANAQIFDNYSNNIFLNTELNNMYKKTWATAHARAEGRLELAAAMDGSRKQGSTTTQKTTDQNTTPASQEDILNKIPMTTGAFQSNGKRIMVPVMLKGLKNLPQEEQKRAEQILLELADNYEKMVEDQGEPHLKNNVAGAVLFAIQVSRVVQGLSDLNDAASRGLLNHINAILFTNTDFQNKMSALQKQQMYETCIIAGGLALMFQQQGKEQKDKEKIDQGQDLAKFLWDQFFDQPVRQVKFTKNGVEFRNKK